MWDRKHFVLSFIVVALAALLAYGGIVYIATIVATDEIGQELALTQWQTLSRVLDRMKGQLLLLAQETAGRPEMPIWFSAEDIPAEQALPTSLVEQLSRSHGIDTVALLDRQGNPRYVAGAQLEDILLLTADLGEHLNAEAGYSGLFSVAGTPALIALAPIVPQDVSTPIGFLFLARALDEGALSEMKSILGRDLFLFDGETLLAATRPTSPRDAGDRFARIRQESQPSPLIPVVSRGTQGMMVATGLLVDEKGRSLGYLQMDIPNLAGSTVRTAVTFASIVAIVLGVGASFILAQAIGGRLADTAEELAERERENARLYAEVGQLNRRLENLLGERTTQLRAATSELHESREQLIHANRLVAFSTLTDNLLQSFERTLSAALADIHALLGEELDAERRRHLLEGIREHLLEGEAALAKLHAYQRPPLAPRRELIDLNQLAKETVEMLRTTMEEADISVHLDFEPHLPRVMVDPTQLQQVLLNLVLNARAAMEGSPQPRELTLRAYPTDGGVALEVLDTGTGIPAEAQERLFQPFFSSKPAHAGSGLSLYISKAILEAHGGSISGGNRQDGRGARFVIELPIGLHTLN